jgi:cobalt-zinc-cadmium efflux system outer membrane protein
MYALQTLMGMPADSVAITLTDSLRLSPRDTARIDLTPVATASVLAAEASLAAAERGVQLQKRSTFQLPSLNVGFEWSDPDQSGILPTIGFAVPLPIFNRNQGPIAEAQAERDRARALLTAARLEARRLLVEGMREREQLIARVVRDRDLIVRAQRVESRSLNAYREGASGLVNVLESRKAAREMLGQYVDDLAALLTINTELRALTQTVSVP